MTLSVGLLLVTACVASVGCKNPAEGKPEAVVGEANEAAAETAQGRRLILAEGTTIGFEGSKVTGSHVGGFNAFEGEINLVDDDPTRSSINVTIDTTSLWSDNDNLTKHLKSADFFEVESFPTASFTSTSIERTDTGYTISGNLDLHGVTKSISFPASIEVGADQVAAKAEFFIKRFDFGIEYKGKADDLIRDEVVIRLDLVASPAA